MKKILLILSFVAASLQAQTNVFTGAIDTNWDNPNNWSLAALPTLTTDVQIPTEKTALLNISSSVRSIHLQGTAVLIIQNNLAISTLQESNTAPLSTISWGSGNISGGGTLNILGLLDIIPGSKQILGGTTTINLSGRMVQDTDWNIDIVDGRFNNMPEGVIELHNSQRNIGGSGFGNHWLYNYGLIRKLGDGTSTISAELHNFGTITVESGSVLLNSPQTVLSDGTYNTFNGTSLVFGGSQTISGTMAGLNSGEIHWSGTMNVPVAANFNFSGNGLFNWGNGHLTGGGILTNSGLLWMTGAYYGTKLIEGGTTLNNAGTIRITNDWSLDVTDGTINNTASGVIDFDISQVQILASGTGSHSINNAGLIKKTLGTGNAQIFAQLNNTGTISVEAGNITLSNALTTLNGGTYNTLAGCYLFNSDTVTLSGSLSGLVEGGINWTADLRVPVTAIFNFTGTGSVNWGSGAIKGGGTLANQSVLDISSGWAGAKSLSESTTLTNSNTLRISTDSAITMNGGTLFNLSSGIIDLQTAGSILAGSGTNNITNFGLLKKSASTGNYTINPIINSTGTIQVDSGSVSLGSLNNTTNGIVKGTGTIYVPTAANFTNNGTFAPGGEPGTLTIIGDYQSNANTRLKVQLYGLTQGTEYDTMTIQNNAVMAGTVVPELHFDAAVGNSFIVANTWGTITSCNLASTATANYNGRSYTFSVGCQDDNKVVLTVTQSVLADEGFALENQIILSPNPARNFISIKNNSAISLKEALISDASGRIIDKVKLTGDNSQIDLGNYVSGMYFMKINSAQDSIVKRFIVE